MPQEAGKRLISAIRKQNEKTSYLCTAGNISPNVVVHETRKSFKRIRALLHFYDEFQNSGIDKFKAKITETGRELSALRESFVNVMLFDQELLSNQLVPEQKLKSALEILTSKNLQLVEKEFYGAGLCAVIQKLLADFNSWLSRVETHPGNKHFFNLVIGTYQKSHQIFYEIPANQPAEFLHELRKKVRRLWFQLDFLRYLNPRYFRVKTSQLNFLVERLGDDHDLHTFQQELKIAELGFNEEDRHILENQVEHLRELNLSKLNPRLTQFFGETPNDFENKLYEIFKPL